MLYSMKLHSIKESPMSAVTELDTEFFAVIADLIDGDMSHEARHMAASMRKYSDKCIEQSYFRIPVFFWFDHMSV